MSDTKTPVIDLPSNKTASVLPPEPIKETTPEPKNIRIIARPSDMSVKPSQMPLNCHMRYSCLRYDSQDVKRIAEEKGEPIDHNMELEMVYMTVTPGSDNIVPYETYMRLLTVKNSTLQKALDAIPTTLEVIFPIPGVEELGLTTDFSVRDAVRIVRDSYDIDWLKDCLTKDGRQGMNEIIRNRLTVLDRSEKAQAIKAQQAVSRQEASPDILFMDKEE